MRPVRDISDQENFRLESKPPFVVPKRDPVEPEPAGTIVLKAFRITGYDQDCDGSLMARMENIDKHGEITGWTPSRIGVGPDTDIVVTTEELLALLDGEAGK